MRIFLCVPTRNAATLRRKAQLEADGYSVEFYVADEQLMHDEGGTLEFIEEEAAGLTDEEWQKLHHLVHRRKL